MKNMLVAGLGLALSVMAFSACKNDGSNNAQTSVPTAEATAAYACPMHPEVTGKQGDACPKCGMDLEPLKTGATANHQYNMAFSSNPATLTAGQAATLSLKPEIVGQSNAAVPLDLHHEKKMHLIAVSKDLSWFDHVHPEYNADGSYQIKALAQQDKFTNGRGHNEIMFERGGDYVLFADYMPTGAAGQLERIPLTVGGTPYKPVAFTQEKRTATVDGYTVTLEPQGKFMTNNALHIAATIRQGGKEVSAESLENYLGAKAHVVVIHSDTEEYLHVHPEVAEGKLDLHATFEKPGIYRAWLQFQTGGKVHTADFVLNVVVGKPGEASQQEGHGEGSEHGHDHGHDHAPGHKH